MQPKAKYLSKNGRRAVYHLALEGLRQTNPKEPLLEIRAWFAVATTQILMFGQWVRIPYFVTRRFIAIVGFVFFEPAYWSLTGAVRIFRVVSRF